MKVCKKCGLSLPNDQFYKERFVCKKCHSNYVMVKFKLTSKMRTEMMRKSEEEMEQERKNTVGSFIKLYKGFYGLK